MGKWVYDTFCSIHVFFFMSITKVTTAGSCGRPVSTRLGDIVISAACSQFSNQSQIL